MKKALKIVVNKPEYLLLLGVLFYWVSTSLLLNPVAIGLTVLLILQLILKNFISGIIIGSILMLLGLYMILALLSELSEFPSFNWDAFEMLLVGSFFLGSILVSAGLMIYKYVNISSSNHHLQ